MRSVIYGHTRGRASAWQSGTARRPLKPTLSMCGPTANVWAYRERPVFTRNGFMVFFLREEFQGRCR